MTVILVLATIILGAMLFDTRERLSRLERRVRASEPPRDHGRRGSILVRDDPVPSAAQSLAVALETSDDVVSNEFDREPGRPAAQMSDHMPEADTIMAAQFLSAPAPEPEEAPAPEEPDKPRHRTSTSSAFSFEDLFGRKLPIWAGGITLIVAAVLMVKYSIDAGLLSPAVRVTLGLLFGGGLIGGAELARRKAHLVQDDRIAQALAGAGVGSLYAATLTAANLYGLISSGVAFAGLSAITASAMLLALRFGAPTAVLGLIGGLATPALVESASPNVPLLAGYLALVIGGLTLLSRRQRWFWLGVSALAGGGAWTALLIVLGGLDQLSSLSIGLLILMLGLGLPFVASADRRGPVLQALAAVIAALQLALLVATGGYALLSWGLYGLLSIAFIWLTTRMPVPRPILAVPLLTSLILAATWPAPPVGPFMVVIAGIVVLFGGSALWRLWRQDGSWIDAVQMVLTALGGFAIGYGQFTTAQPGEDVRFALLALGFAVLPAIGAALGWSRPDRHGDPRFAILTLSSGLLTMIAILLGLPDWAVPVALALLALMLLLIGETAQDRHVRNGAVVSLGIALLALLATSVWSGEIMRLIGPIEQDVTAKALLRWTVLLAAMAVFAWRFAAAPIRFGLQALAALLGYGLIAQILPAPWLALATAIALLVMTEVHEQKTATRLLPAQATLAVLILLWALEPLLQWALPGILSLAGEPMLASGLPAPGLTAQRLFLPTAICALALWRTRARLPIPLWEPALALFGMAGLIGAHIFYKQLFQIDDGTSFIRNGLIERTLWEAMLIGAGFAVWQVLRAHGAALALAGIGLAHNLIYTLLLHDPIWSAQAVGPWPVANLLLPAFGIAILTPTLIARIAPEHAPALRRPADLLRMAAILLLGFATLRQIFSGSLLIGTELGALENIGRSILAIALAIGFLLWGLRHGLRNWRIASLLLMLLAVGKVFLFDASGLEGLLRILSFLALGFSLIGIGWLYSRTLKSDKN